MGLLYALPKATSEYAQALDDASLTVPDEELPAARRKQFTQWLKRFLDPVKCGTNPFANEIVQQFNIGRLRLTSSLTSNEESNLLSDVTGFPDRFALRGSDRKLERPQDILQHEPGERLHPTHIGILKRSDVAIPLGTLDQHRRKAGPQQNVVGEQPDRPAVAIIEGMNAQEAPVGLGQEEG
jgi:hypothetical protein